MGYSQPRVTQQGETCKAPLREWEVVRRTYGLLSPRTLAAPSFARMWDDACEFSPLICWGLEGLPIQVRNGGWYGSLSVVSPLKNPIKPGNRGIDWASPHKGRACGLLRNS